MDAFPFRARATLVAAFLLPPTLAMHSCGRAPPASNPTTQATPACQPPNAEPPRIAGAHLIQARVRLTRASDGQTAIVTGVLVGPDTLAIPWEPLVVASSATAELSCCEEVGILGVVATDEWCNLALVAVEHIPEAPPPPPVAQALPASSDTLLLDHLLPIHVADHVATAFMRAPVTSVRDWPSRGVLIRMGVGSDLAPFGSPLFANDGSLVALTIQGAGAGMLLAAPIAPVMASERHSAIPLAEYHTREHPAFAEARVLAGEASRSRVRGDLDRAQSLASRAIALDPRSYEATYTLGVIADLRGDPNAAIEFLDRSIDLEPRWSESHYSLGLVFLRLQRWGDALERLELATELDPDYAKPQGMRGLALSKLGRTDEAIAAMTLATTLEPELPDSWLNLDGVFEELGREDDRLNLWSRAIDAAPEWIEPWLRVADIHIRARRYADAIAPLSVATRLDPDLADAHAKLAIAYWALGKLDLAEDAARTALACPDPPDITQQILDGIRRDRTDD